MSDGDREASTPRTTGSWSIFSEIAESLVIRLRDAVFTWSGANPLRRDAERAAEAEALIPRLQALEWKFRAWPEHPERATQERPVLCPELMALQRQAEELLSRKPRKWWQR
ncbi:MAG: hypothetical protein WKG00_03410 [Polyangiaceae bacterium]